MVCTCIVRCPRCLSSDRLRKGYLIAEPETAFTRTLFLVGLFGTPKLHGVFLKNWKNVLLIVIKIHGFPDLSMAWRYQIPLFLKQGFRVVAPDCIGYGRSVSVALQITMGLSNA